MGRALPPPVREPEPEVLTRDYRVIGPHSVEGVPTGGTVSLPETQGALLADAGHVERVDVEGSFEEPVEPGSFTETLAAQNDPPAQEPETETGPSPEPTGKKRG